MTDPDHEERLRRRVGTAVAAMPGPDPARLAAIRRALPRRRRRTPALVWGIAAAGALAAAAGASAWYLQGAGTAGDTPVGDTSRGAVHEAAEPPAHEPAGATDPAGDAAREDQPSDRIIYRE